MKRTGLPEYYNTELFLPECHRGHGADLLVGSTVARYEEDRDAGVFASLQVAGHLSLAIGIQPILGIGLQIGKYFARQ